jgi:hypothetical protein
MLGSVFEPAMPLRVGSKKLEIEVDFDNTKKIELIFFDTLMYLAVFVMLWIHRKSLNIVERYARMIGRTSFQQIPAAIRHPGSFFTASFYTRLTSYTP